MCRGAAEAGGAAADRANNLALRAANERVRGLQMQELNRREVHDDAVSYSYGYTVFVYSLLNNVCYTRLITLTQ